MFYLFEIMAQQETRATQALASIAAEITNASQAIVAIARPFQVMGMPQVGDQQRNNLAMLVQMESRLRDLDNRIAYKMKQKEFVPFWKEVGAIFKELAAYCFPPATAASRATRSLSWSIVASDASGSGRTLLMSTRMK